MKNRIQFRRHNPIFDTREEAVKYLMNDVRFAEEGLASSDKSHGLSLYAEPTVLRYKNEDDETNPYVILAIAATTNESAQYNENRFCFIDTHKTEAELEEIHEDIDRVVKSLSIVTKDTNTIKLHSEITENGTIVSGDVVIAESQILNDYKKPNIILGTEDGIYTFVDLNYDIETHILSFTVNGDTKDMDLGIENFYVQNGWYDRKDESIHLLRNDGEEIVVNLENLINEWDVEGEASKTPIVLTREEVGYGSEDDTHSHVEPWQDVLKADVRLLDAKYNILEKTTDGRYLFVDGLASNITYFKDGKEMSVQDALDDITVDVSGDKSNIIYTRADGIYAAASLEYVGNENKLLFKTSNVTGGTTTQEVKLNSVEFFKEVYYDKSTEELVIMYVDSNGEIQKTSIPIGQWMTDWEWDIQNDGHNVKLHKNRVVNGNDKVSADVDIFEGHNNILEDVNHQLYVRGEADNIKYGNDSNVSAELDKLNEFTSDIDNRLKETDKKVDSVKSELDDEIARAKENEDRIEAKLDAEVERSTEKDAEHDSEIKNIYDTIGEGFDIRNTVRDEFDKEKSERVDADNYLQSEIDSLSADTASRLIDIINNDKTINIDKEDPIRPVISVNLSEEVEQDRYPNLIKLNADGLYVGADLSYEYVKETGKSMLVFRTSKGTKNIDIQPASIIDHIEYNSQKEALVIYYYVGGVMTTVEVPLGDLIDEWDASDVTTGAIKLTKTRDDSKGKDILSAETLINTSRGDNILENVNGELYVSSSSITQNANDIDALENSRLTTITTDGSMLVDGDHTSTGLTPNLSVKLSEKNNLSTNVVDGPFGNLIELYDDGLYASIDIECIAGDNKNTLVLKTTKGKKEIDLVANADIRSMVYNKQTENIELTFGVSGEEPKTIYCDVTDLIDEWTIDNPLDYAVTLYKVKNDSRRDENGNTVGDVGPDILSADVKISDAPTNILQKLKSEFTGAGALFVDGTQISANTASIEKNATDIRALEDRMSTAETNISDLDKALLAEKNERIASDTTLQNNIDAEVTRAQTEEGRIETKLDNEITRSTEKDTELENRMGAAEGNINNLEKALSEERNNRIAADTDLQNNINAEATRAQTEESRIETKLDNEITRSTNKDSELDKRVSTAEGNINNLEKALSEETNNRIAGDTTLQNNIEDEATRAQTEESRIETKLDGEITRSTDKDAELDKRMGAAEGNINNLEKALSEETNNRISGDTTLQTKIDAEVTRAKTEESRIETKLDNEIARSTEKDTELEANLKQEKIARESADDTIKDAIRDERNLRVEGDANLTILIGDERSRATVEEQRIEGLLNEEISRAKVKESEIETNLDKEIARSTTEDKNIWDAITKEIKDRQDGDNDLNEAIKAATLKFADTTSVRMEKNDSNNVVTSKVKVATGDDNIIYIDGEKEGIYASVALDYDPATNKIWLVTSGGKVSKSIQLNAGSLIDDMVYDPVERSLVITYTQADGIQKSVKFPVNDLFNDWIVVNPSENTAIELTKKLGGAGEPDELSGRVLLTNLEDNVVSIVNNGLYVSGSAMTEALEISECVKKELKVVENAVLGQVIGNECGEGYTYTPNPTSHITSGATNMKDADTLLDQAIYEMSGTLDCISSETKSIEDVLGVVGNCDTVIKYPISHNCLLSGATSFADADLLLEEAVCMLLKMMVGSDTASANMEVVQEGLNQWFEVNVRLSHGNGRSDVLPGLGGDEYLQEDEDLYITDFSGDTIEEGYTEFTDTNVLRIVDLTPKMSKFEFQPTAPYNGVYLSNEWNCGQYTKDGVGTPYEKYMTDEADTEQDIFRQRYRNIVKQ